MRRAAIAIAVAAVAATFAPAADAAMCIRLFAQPAQPRVGAATQVGLGTYMPMRNGALRLWNVRRYPFRVEAVSPTRRVHRIKVRHSRANPYAWVGSFRFPRMGNWIIRVTNFAPYSKGCGEVLLVRVSKA